MTASDFKKSRATIWLRAKPESADAVQETSFHGDLVPASALQLD
jgi:hypothetical protein